MAFDQFDREIIGAMVEDGRLSVRSLADRIGLGPSATSDRLRPLESDGVIAGYTAVLDGPSIGRPIDAIIDVQVGPDHDFYSLDPALADIPEVVEAMHMTGQFDYQLRLSCRSVEDLEQVLVRLKDLGVRQTNTRIVLRRVTGMPRAPQLTPPDRPIPGAPTRG